MFPGILAMIIMSYVFSLTYSLLSVTNLIEIDFFVFVGATHIIYTLYAFLALLICLLNRNSAIWTITDEQSEEHKNKGDNNENENKSRR